MKIFMKRGLDLARTMQKTWTGEEKQKDRKDLSFIEIYLSSNILQEVLLAKIASALWLKLESM
jgi:hypothetical protein